MVICSSRRGHCSSLGVFWRSVSRRSHQKPIIRSRPSGDLTRDCASHRVRDIAVQAGLSEATVDRVLNGRPACARARRRGAPRPCRPRPAAAQVRLGGRTFLIDLVMQAPTRFSSAVRAALEAELPALRPAVLRARFHLRETASAAGIVATLDGRAAARFAGRASSRRRTSPRSSRPSTGWSPPASRSSPWSPTCPQPAPRLRRHRQPGRRCDRGVPPHAMAGRAEPGTVLVTLSRGSFRGEEEREMGFRVHPAPVAPRGAVVNMTRPTASTPPSADWLLAALDRRSGDPRGLLHRRRQPRHRPGVRRPGRECTAASSPTTSTPTTSHSCAPARSPRSCTTTSGDFTTPARSSCPAQNALPGFAVALSAIQVVTPHNVP